MTSAFHIVPLRPNRHFPDKSSRCSWQGPCNWSLRLSIVMGLVASLLTGCQSESSLPVTPAQESKQADTPALNSPLRVLVIDDPPLAEAIARQWKAHARETLEMTSATSDQIPTKLPDSDVIIYPSSYLGPLVKDRVVVPWPAKWQPLAGQAHAEATLAAYDWDGLLPQLSRHELRWANELYGVSFGSPQWMLFYRADLLRAWSLEPPTTWQEYLTLSETLRQRLQEVSAVPSADVSPEASSELSAAQQIPRFVTIEPLGSGWAAKILLARSAAYARHPNQYSTFFHFVTMEALIDQPPYQRAWNELQSTVQYMPPDVWDCDPDQAMTRFLNGESVMAWGWPSRARATGRSSPSDAQTTTSMEFGVAPLPGSSQVYQVAEAKWEDREVGIPTSVSLLGISGRMGSITRRCRVPDAACNLLLWLTGNEASAQIATKSRYTSAFRLSHLNQPTPWVDPQLEPLAAEYAKLVGKTQTYENVISLRIPGQSLYLAALDEAIRSVQRSPEASPDPEAAATHLKAVAQKWNQLTNEWNRDKQRQAYAESLGLQAP